MSRKLLDLTGDRYGRLLVLKESKKVKNERYWLCKCDCGNEKSVRMSQLRTGKSKSCGCINREITSKVNTKNLTGKRYGKLLVIKRADERHGSQTKAMWDCLCDCGKPTTVMSTYLTTGDTTSCGCHKYEIAENLQKFNREEMVEGVAVPLLKSKVRTDNKTGVKGVTYSKASGKYRASLTIKGKRINLGYHKTVEEAAAARKVGEEKYHKPYLEKTKKGNRSN